MRRSPTRMVGVLGVAAVLLAGCLWKSDPVNENLTVAEAKSSTQSVELQIVEAIPLAFLNSVVQKERGVFLSCGDGGALLGGFAHSRHTRKP